MESWSRQATERETTHLPLGERPTAYPPGIDGPGPGFSGDLLVRVTVTSADTDAGLPMAEPAPVPKKRATACNAKQARSVHADELPVVSRMAIATGMSDDPSETDRGIWKKINDIAKLFGTEAVDHVVVTWPDGPWHSEKESGQL